MTLISPNENKIFDRSHCVKILDKTEKVLFHYGEGFLYEPVPAGTRVIYPPPSIESIQNIDAAIEYALENPIGCNPLSAQLKAGMKVTIAFDDISVPLPPMQSPDIRQRIIKKVLQKLGDAGVTDIHLIAAIGLHRRMTPAELKHVVGKKVFKAFYPDRLYNHDAEDKANVVFLGHTDKHEVVEINRRAVESDLLIYVNINIASQSGGHKAVATGLGTYRTLKHHHNVDTLMNSRSYMDPPNSALHHSCDRMGEIVESNMNIFRIESTINNTSLPQVLGFLLKPFWEYNYIDKVNLYANKISTDILPTQLKRKVYNRIYAPYQVTGIHAGRTELVHDKTLENVYRQHVVPVKGQSDIVIMGVPYLGPYSVHSILNPILFMCLTVGYFFNFYRGKPLVKQGGVYILTYPLHEDFHLIHHPSYIEFYERVLTETIDSKKIEEKYEEEFAYNPKYIDLFRNSYAFHGVHAFYAWYWGCHGFSHVEKVIVVKPKSKRPAEIMGFETADSLSEAIEKAKDYVGNNPSISCYQTPPYLLCDVS
jgi:hypothetical protein